jgi:galacturan 1,4-alpha-galacturonidase
MKFPTLLALAGSGLLASSSPTLLSDECSDLSPRPVVNLAPYNPRLPIPDPPERTKVCYVKGFNDGVTDDSCRIMAALHKCNNGGRVVFKSDTKYLIGSAMDLTFLRHIDIGEGHNDCNEPVEV